jgi:hypothetical protein
LYGELAYNFKNQSTLALGFRHESRCRFWVRWRLEYFI